MKRKVLITINGRKYTVQVDDELDLSLRKILKSDYQFNNEGILSLEEKSLDANYQVKQLLLHKLLMAMPQDSGLTTNDRLKEIERYTNQKNTIYYSDLQELERIYTEASNIYNDILSGKYSKEEQDLKSVDQDLVKKGENTPATFLDSESEDSFDSKITEATASDETSDNASDIKDILLEAASSPELSSYIDDRKIEEVTNKIQVAKSAEEFTALTNEDINNLDVSDYLHKTQTQARIILPPISSDAAENIALDTYIALNNTPDIKEAVTKYKNRKKDFNNKIQSSFNTLSSNFKLKGGINSRNLNAFGNDFLASYIQLCQETGTSPEEMFKEYFSNSSSTRGNSVLNKFITQFIRASGGDESLRDLIETTLVKKAIANNLVTSKYNNYLKEGYRELSFNRNGAINFNFKNEIETETSITGNVSSNITREVNVSQDINREVSASTNINENIKETKTGGIGPSQMGMNIKQTRPNSVNIPNVPNVNGKITQNVPGANLNKGEDAATAAAKADLDKLNTFSNPALSNNANIPANDFLNVPTSSNAHPNDLNSMPHVPASVPSSGNSSSLGVNPDMELAHQKSPQNNKFAQNKNFSNKKGKQSPLGIINNRDKNLKQRNDKKDLIAGSGFRKNNLMSPKTINDLENEADLQDNSASNETGNKSAENSNSLAPNQLPNNNALPDNNDSNPLKDAAENLKNEAKKKLGEIIIAFIKKNPWVLVVVLGILLISTLLMMGNDDEAPKMTGLGGYSYLKLSNVCEEIYVYDTPSGEDGTYPLEEYVAGVVAHEVGAFNNDTLYEVFAIAARTYALNRLQGSDSCSIKGNSTAQVFGKTDNERIIAAANNTRGLVLTRNGSLISTEYDAFCWDTKDNDFYYVCQKNYDTGEALKVPVDWATEHVGRISGKPFLENSRYHSHGRGMSQDGAWYMADELGYDKDKILTFFYGSSSKIMSIYASSYSGEFPLNPNDELYQNLAFLINESLESFLNRNGTSVEEFNAYLNDVATKSGLGTRESVVNVAVSFIGSLANMGYKLNYQWGGRHDMAGVKPSWGTSSQTSCSTAPNASSCRANFVWSSMDCNGFVNWVYANAFGNEEYRKRGIYNKTKTQNSKRVNLQANKAVCQAGDVLISPGSHIVLVVGVDEAKKKYIVAESTGSNIAAKTGGVKLTYYSYNASTYFCGDMSSIYNNDKGEK